MAVTEKEFDAFARGLQLKHISPSELRTKCDRIGNSLPPRILWHNIVRPAWIVDLLRSNFDRPVRIHSTFRAPAYNSAVGGVSNSIHLEFGAIDFSIDGVNPREVAMRLTAWRAAGLFLGGIGTYRTFVHVDCRGHNATWP